MPTAASIIRQSLPWAIFVGIGTWFSPYLLRAIIPEVMRGIFPISLLCLLIVAPQALPWMALKIRDDLYGRKLSEEFMTTMFSSQVLKKLTWIFLAGLLLLLGAIFVIPLFHNRVVSSISAVILVLILTQWLNYLQYARIRDLENDQTDPAHSEPGKVTAWWIVLRLIPTHVWLYLASLAFFGAAVASIEQHQLLYLILGFPAAGLLFFLAYSAAQRFVELLDVYAAEPLTRW